MWTQLHFPTSPKCHHDSGHEDVKGRLSGRGSIFIPGIRALKDPLHTQVPYLRSEAEAAAFKLNPSVPEYWKFITQL